MRKLSFCVLAVCLGVTLCSAGASAQVIKEAQDPLDAVVGGFETTASAGSSASGAKLAAVPQREAAAQAEPVEVRVAEFLKNTWQAILRRVDVGGLWSDSAASKR